MWFNRNSTENQQALETLKARLDAVERELAAEKSANNRNLLEYAELGEKMRRLYLRIARRAKIELEESSEPESTPEENSEPSPLEIREAIERKMAAL